MQRRIQDATEKAKQETGHPIFARTLRLKWGRKEHLSALESTQSEA